MSAAEVAEADGLEPPEPPTPVLTPATPRELRGLMKDWRRGRATRNLGQALSDAYVAVIAALMIGAMTVNVILKAQRVVAGCSTASCLSARALLPWAAVLAARRDRARRRPAVRAGAGLGGRGLLAARRPDLAGQAAAVPPRRRAGRRARRRRA